MAGVRKKPSRGGNFQGWDVDASGRRKFFTGTQGRNETARMAQRLTIVRLLAWDGAFVGDV